MNFEDAVSECPVRGAIYRSSEPLKEFSVDGLHPALQEVNRPDVGKPCPNVFWKNQELPLHERIPAEAQAALDWNVWDPRECDRSEFVDYWQRRERVGRLQATVEAVFDAVELGDLKRLDFVQWDRYAAAHTGELVVYGWIPRQDGRSDFVVLTYTASGGLGYVTSSAQWTEEIGRRLGFEGNTHRECLRVEDVEATRDLPNVVRLSVDRVL